MIPELFPETLRISSFRSRNPFYQPTVFDAVQLSDAIGLEKSKRVQQTFDEFNESWLIYWNAYIDLQNQLYESLKAAREVAWLAATDSSKMSEINAAQRQLFASMPRRLDYVPLGQVNKSMTYALGRINELEKALTIEKDMCKKIETAIDILMEKAGKTRQELQNES